MASNVLAILVACAWLSSSVGQVLTPPYFNLAEGRRITATATCGVDVDEPELYCKLVGADSDKPSQFNVIQGQLCDTCDPHDPRTRHPPEDAIDGSERWWQSPPISRGMNYNQVNLTIDLGQLFQVAYVVIKMANSPRPGIWVLERSVDNGETYTPWQYFADSYGDCERFFGVDTVRSITEDDDVICTTRFSKVVPLEGGEIFVSLLNDRPSSKNFFNSSVLQEFTRATNVRLRLLRTKTLLGHLMSVARQDPTVTRRYFYSIKDISIGGRCVCNGHASVCDITDPNDRYKLQCRCQHNTCGSRCEECCPGFIQKKWRPASYTENFICEPCNCHSHSNECIFDEQVNAERGSLDIFGSYEGGGVCQNCQHYTEGINCDKCISGYYRPYDRQLNDTYVCHPCQCNSPFNTGNCFEGNGQCECRIEFLPPNCDACNDGYYDYPNCKPCDCHKDGTVGGICEVGGGQCPCKSNYQGTNCDQCAPGYFKFPECIPCDCVGQGSSNYICDVETGQCPCLNNYGGQSCDQCENGFFNYPNNCTFCNCDSRGTEPEICDKKFGDCICLEGYSGERCDNNAPGFWGYPLVQYCGCHEKGSSSTICDASGKCACLHGYSGRSCDQCSPGYFGFPNCISCDCDQSGSNGISCNKEGKCVCHYNFDGINCDRCRDNFYNFPICEECNCHPAGVLETFAGCGNAPAGELCECKERVTGRICNKCRPLYWNLIQSNTLGCEECNCNTPGTIGALATCDMDSGQCSCKPHVTSHKCDQCKDGTFNLMEDNLFGCSDCQCNIGGSVNNNCNKFTGQCQCRYRVEGQRCDRPMQLHYFPTLYQNKYEAEDGRTPHNTPVRFGYDGTIFPGFSWRGYAVYSELQKETLHDVYISKPSLYRIIFFYMNPSNQRLNGKVTITPENPQDDKQEVEVVFHPTNGPELFTVSTLNGFPLPFVLNPGVWTLSIQNTHQNLFIDYFVLLPLAYYEATILSEVITSSCQASRRETPCLHYAYPDVSNYNVIYGSAGYVDINGTRSSVEMYDDQEVLSYLQSPPMAWLSANQQELQFDIRLRHSGPHVILINYFTPEGVKATNVQVTANTQSGREQARAVFYDCSYSWPCRQVVQSLEGEVAIFYFDTNYVNIIISTQQATGTDIAIHSVAVVPLEKWNMNHVLPRVVCTRIGDDCVDTPYKNSPEAVKVEFEDNFYNKSSSTQPEGVDNSTTLVYLNSSDSTIDIRGSLRSAGRYIFVIHYFQPTHTNFELDALLQNGQYFEGILPLEFCPSTSGCRSILKKLDGSDVFDILENFVLTLNLAAGKEKDAWLDYVMVIHEDSYSPEILSQIPRDKTKEFFNKCGNNHYNIDPSESGFCRESAFALTSNYNNGALPCQCNFEGSIRFECEVFGGQCACKPNVIGRECNQCKTGYFGFPDCQPCDCPSTALCDPITGECICPPRVIGERCERCAMNTYGFDPIIGCEECRCNEIGVQGRELQCNLNTGQCMCKFNVVGKRCERCAAGYWSFPFCQLCACDIRGTEDDICSQSDATCFCKANTRGRSCDECERGTYNLEETNPDGCTKCFCFGKSQSCSSSYLSWGLIPGSPTWDNVLLKVVGSSLMVSDAINEPINYPNLSQLNLTQYNTPEEDGFVYYSVPKAYLGRRITSYGGKLSYKILSISSVRELDLTGEADIVLKGNNITGFYFYETQVENSRQMSVSVELQERNFRTISGVSIRREQFMMLLNHLDAIYIRAQYDEGASEARIKDFTIEMAVEPKRADDRKSLSVEKCQCPPNYQGSSCEDCADGFYRADAGPFGGYCVPCQCNNHANTCDPVTGICFDCKDNSMGDHCEECIGGYFGNALRGTPYDCLICSCPMPFKSNNFATSCSQRSDEEIICQCKPGYSGSRCDTCAPGFYGRPKLLEDYCKPCECNNNIDPSSPSACDDIGGLCLTCLNNSFGPKCERCSPGFFGDAVLLKNCQKCSCDDCGTRECNHYTGVCECHANVVGDNCDRCAPDYWGFASCQGCHQCNCEEASESRQCDEDTGQCRCKPGVTGQRCDRCKPGFWKYTEFGCTECACRSGFSVGVGCDPLTGQCSCLPGVIGDNCEGCPDRWVLVEGRGCQECDDCVHDLLDSTDSLGNMISPVIEEYESAAQSFFLHQRLQVINESINLLRPKVDSFDLSDEDLRPVNEALDKLYTDAIAISAKGELLDNRATKSGSDGLAVRNQATEVLDSIEDGHNLSRDVVDEINFLVVGLETGKGSQIESAIAEAEEIVAQMSNRTFNNKNDEVRADFEIAEEFLDRIRNLLLPGVSNKAMVNASIARLVKLEGKINEMHKHISESKDKYNGVAAMNHKSRVYGLDSLNKKYSEIDRLGEIAEIQINDAQNYTELAKTKLEEVEQHYFILDSQYSTLNDANTNLNESVFEKIQQYEDAIDPSYAAIYHAGDLQNRANQLDNMLTDTRQATENALNAANANENIVAAIDDAYDAAIDARNASKQALDLSNGISDSAKDAVRSSEKRYEEAEAKTNLVEEGLKPQLREAQEKVKNLEHQNKFAEKELDRIDRQWKYLDSDSLEKASSELQQEATQVFEEAALVNDNVASQYNNLAEYATEARLLSKNIEDAKRDTKLALDQVANVETLLPAMQKETQNLLDKKNRIHEQLADVGNRLERLRRTITKTRVKTNEIKVGIDFEQGSVLELKNPEDLSDTATSTELSVMIKTYDESGLPLFLGTPEGGSDLLHRTSTDDFMAIEIVNGYVRLTTNLGAGARSIINDQYVANNEWHKIYIKRIGKVVQLSVSHEDENRNEVTSTVEEVLHGTYSILNLDPKVSKLYVGGIPTGVKVDDTLINTYYTGQMEDLWLNKRPIGLWNFVNRGSTDFPLNGAKERLVLKELKINSYVLRFDGSGYMSTSTKGHETTPELSIVLSFKTYAEDGLLYLLKNGPNEYVSLEMRGGKVRYQHSFKERVVTLLTDGLYNEDEWHTIEATRVRGDAVMKIDGSDFQAKRSGYNAADFTAIPEVMYFGGYPGNHMIEDITNEDFRGCIQDVKVTEVTVDFSRSQESIGTVPGCTVEEVGLVSFQSGSPGFIKLPSAEGNGMQLVFKFKTDHPNGLLFYTESKDRTIYLSLSLVDGALVLRSAPGGDLTTGTYTNYNDSEWHIVIATKENNELRLDIDDYEKFSLQLIQESLPFDGPVFFGGIPRYYSISASAASGGTNFFGCIGDATLNGKIVDFASASKSDRPGSLLETCSLAKKEWKKPYDYGDSKYPTDSSRDPSPIETSSEDYYSSPSSSPTYFQTSEVSVMETTTPPLQQCALPVVPMVDEDISTENGLRFGGKRDSRIEYDELPGIIRGDFSFAVDFKTWASDGIIFYAANMNHRDFVSLYMNDGKIVFNFSPGSSPAIMRSIQRYNDNEWHKLVAHRIGDFGRLEVDGFIVANGTTYGESKHIEEKAPYYFGGLNNEIVELAKDNTEQTLLSFNGCLKGFRMNNKLVGGKRRVIAISECSNKVEPGVFFGEGKLSHAVVRLKFNVGLTFDMTLDIKPRRENGVIMSVHGKKDFLLLQLRNGIVEVKVDNGKGIVTAQYNFTNTYQICDGQWHSIQILKNKHVIVLVVDGVNTSPAAGSLGASSTDTHNPLFLGSQPRLGRRRGNAVADKFVGCIRNVSVNSDQIDLAYTLFVGEVNAGVCPLI